MQWHFFNWTIITFIIVATSLLVKKYDKKKISKNLINNQYGILLLFSYSSIPTTLCSFTQAYKHINMNIKINF